MAETPTGPCTLVTATRSLLAKRMEDESLICISAGSGLPYHWVRNFRYGASRNPAVDKVQRLYEHLAGEKLTLRS